jgi:hypothetical protein
MLGIEGYLKNQRIAQHWFKSELSFLLFQLIDEFRTVLLLHAHLQTPITLYAAMLDGSWPLKEQLIV